MNSAGRTPEDELELLLVNNTSSELEEDVKDIRRILQEKYGFLHCLMIRNHYSKPRTSSLTLILYVVFMIITMVI